MPPLGPLLPQDCGFHGTDNPTLPTFCRAQLGGHRLHGLRPRESSLYLGGTQPGRTAPVVVLVDTGYTGFVEDGLYPSFRLIDDSIIGGRVRLTQHLHGVA